MASISMKRHLPTLLLLVIALLSGCASQPSRLGGDQDLDETQSQEAEESLASFEPDTLYDLMVAELGGQRQRYDLALGNYLKQAHKTQDKGVAQRAYQIASFIGAKQAALDAAMLWSTLSPDDLSALQASALELMRSGEPDQAIARMEQILELDDSIDFEFMATHAAALEESERGEVLSSFTRVALKYPDNRSLILGKAILLQQANRSEEALALCDSLLKKDAEYIKALIIKGRILNKLGRDAEAERMLAEEVKRHPDRARLRLIYARVLVHANKLDLAKEQFEVLLQQSPNDSEIILSLGLIAMDNGLYGEAEGYLQRLLSLGYRQNTANFYLGKLSEEKQQWSDAKEYYRAVSPGKEFMMAQVALTQMLVKRNQWQEARKLLDQTRSRYPTHVEQLYLLEGEILVKREEFKEALALFDHAIERSPQGINLLYSRAMVLEKLDRIEDLEKDLRKILAMQPDNAVVLNALGYTLADRTGRLKEASELIAKAYAINSEDPAIIDSMGWMQYRLGNLNAALDYLQQAYEKFPDAEVAAHLGEVLWKLGRKEEARTIWGKALKSQPTSKVVQETMQRLDNEKKPRPEIAGPSTVPVDKPQTRGK